MKIGILQTGEAPDALRPKMGDYPDFFETLLEKRGLTFNRYRVLEMEFPKDVHECEGWLITGSRFGAYEDHAFIPPLEEFIRRSYSEGVPVVGICFGHQIIAQAMGGKVEKYKGGWSVGPTEYDFEGEKITLNAWHQDQVVEVPDHAQVIGTNSFCEAAALLYDDRMLTFQAHPEFNREFMNGLIEKRGPGLVAEEVLTSAKSRLDRDLDRGPVADRIAKFFFSHQDLRSKKA